jgi:hypothetical protein
MARIRSHLTYANVMVTILTFIVLGGGAYAAATIGSDDIKDNAVHSRHIQNGQVVAADLKQSKWNVVGDANGPDFGQVCCSCPVHPDDPVAFLRDDQGFVHLRGSVYFDPADSPSDNCTLGNGLGASAFTLPPGFRPEQSTQLTSHWGGAPGSGYGDGQNHLVEIRIYTDPIGYVLVNPREDQVASLADVYLDGLSFRCGPSGEHGCP